jgi:hypothetical protein
MRIRDKHPGSATLRITLALLFCCRHDGGDYRQAAGEGHRPHPGEKEEGQDCPRGQYLPRGGNATPLPALATWAR